MLLNRFILPLKRYKCYINPNKLLHSNPVNHDQEIFNGIKLLPFTAAKKETATVTAPGINFSPRSIANVLDVFDDNKTRIFDMPLVPLPPSLPPSNKFNVDLPSALLDLGFECPTVSGLPEKHAVRLIVIRRKKMKKHKLKKLRKKMKYVWARLRKRRKIRKEKAFRASVWAKIKEAEDFSAEQYVTDKLRQANEEPIPRYWKGKRLPRFLIRQLMGLDPKIEYNKFKNTN